MTEPAGADLPTPAAARAPEPPARPGRRRALGKPALVAAGAVLAVVLGVVATVVALQSGGGTSGSPSADATSGPRPAKLDPIEVGDCLGVFVTDFATSELFVVPCDEPHEQKVIYLDDAFVGDAWSGDVAYPGQESLEDSGHELCQPEFTSYVGLPWVQSQLQLFAFAPAKAGWGAGERWLLCVVAGTESLSESVKGSGR